MTAPIWISERDVGLDLKQSIALLREAMTRQAEGRALNMNKTHVQWTGGTMHAIGACFEDTALLGVKAWAHTPKGATPLEILWDAETGRLLAIIEAFAMGQLRTAGMAGLATDCLADARADLFALCGTGKQAMAQLAAVHAVRPLRTVRLFGRNAERRGQFAQRAAEAFGVSVEQFDDAERAISGAPVVTLVTRATAPFVAAAWPARGAHINAMGAITPERQEFEPALLKRCAVVAADSVQQAQALASEMIAAWGDDFSAAKPLCDIVAAGGGRPQDADLTLFKSLGVGIADLALAEALYRTARERGVGTPLPTPAPAPLVFGEGGKLG
ncbi:MAG: ornithine cyclodeaminase family protein [Alphaproteobacteria bacterium]|nr:ornithine cyclodeaminase family protein [Alphaproteobacteria bacterium]